jgi:predicted kinase
VAERTRGVKFSLDHWLITSFGRYSIDEIGHAEHVRRVLGARDLIWEAATELLTRDVDVVLDDGFFQRVDRTNFAQRARSIGAHATIHHLDTPLEVIRKRLRQRNAKLPQYNFRIALELLDSFRDLYEVPSTDEGAELVVVHDAGAGTPARTAQRNV